MTVKAWLPIFVMVSHAILVVVRTVLPKFRPPDSRMTDATPVPTQKLVALPDVASELTTIGPPYACIDLGEKLIIALLALPGLTIPDQVLVNAAGQLMDVTASGAFPPLAMVNASVCVVPVTTLPKDCAPVRAIIREAAATLKGRLEDEPSIDIVSVCGPAVSTSALVTGMDRYAKPGVNVTVSDATTVASMEMV